MTTTGAIFQLHHVVIDNRRIHFLMFVLFEVTRMAAGTVRFVAGKFPRDDFIIGRMTVIAKHTGSMCFVSGIPMGIGSNRCPRDTGSVTAITRLRRDKVSRRLASRGAPVMTGGTAPRRHARMTERGGRPGR